MPNTYNVCVIDAPSQRVGLIRLLEGVYPTTDGVRFHVYVSYVHHLYAYMRSMNTFPVM